MLIKYDPPIGIGRRMSYRDQPIRHRYDLPAETAEDVRLDTTVEWSGRTFDQAVVEAMEKQLMNRVRSAVED